MVLKMKRREGHTPKASKGQGKGASSKETMLHKRSLSWDTDEASPVPKKVMKKDDDAEAEPEFTYIRFKFLLRSPDTQVKALQTFLEVYGGEEWEEEGRQGLQLLESYLKSSPQCSEVLELLTPQATSQQVSLVFSWIKLVLQRCPSLVKGHQDLQSHLVRVVLSQHYHVILNSLRHGNKTGNVKATLMLLLTIASLGEKFAREIHTCLDFNHANWLPLLQRRDRKDEIDVRACMTAILMTLLQVEDEEVTRSLVDQRVLLQDVMLGLKYDRSEYVIHSLNTIHRCVVLDSAVGKNSKMYLFNSPVLKELLALYQWPGPSQWKCKPTDDLNKEYTEEQQKVADQVHPVMVSLLTSHKLGLCFRDRAYGMAQNKNSTVAKVLKELVTSYTSRCPLLPQLATAILQACPDQTPAFLKLLQPHLSPRPLQTWVLSLSFFLKIMGNHQWPDDLVTPADAMLDDGVRCMLTFLFPPEPIVTSLKGGLKSPCASVRTQCLQALNQLVTRADRLLDICDNQQGSEAPLTLAIQGVRAKTLPNAQMMYNLVHMMQSKDNFTVPITRDLHTNDSHTVSANVSRFQHLVIILQTYTLAPQYLTEGPVDTLASLLQQVTAIVTSKDAIDRPAEGVSGNLPSLYLLQALSQCDACKLTLFGKGGSKADLRTSLVYQLVSLLQANTTDTTHTHTARALIAKLLAGTGLFEGQETELEVWLRHLQSESSAPEEVVTFAVSLLHQYMSNPYPAVDRLLDMLEEEETTLLDDEDDSVVSPVRQEFSPLAMLALEGEFFKQEKVCQYLSLVLMDLLHTLHAPGRFSRLVHGLSSHLPPEVTLYLTLHSSQETMTSHSLAQRLGKKTRIKQLKTFPHSGVVTLKTLLKVKDGEWEVGVEEMVGELSPPACLPLIHLCLRYLEDLMSGAHKTQGQLLNTRLADVCLATLRVASLRLAATSTDDATKVKVTPTGGSTEHADQDHTEPEPGTDTSPPHPQPAIDWFQEAVSVLLTHPLLSHWLFEVGCMQGGNSMERVVAELCDIVQSLRLGQRSNVDVPFSVPSKCRLLLQSVSWTAETSVYTETIQPLLCRVLETLFSLAKGNKRAEVLLTLVSLPAENFTAVSKDSSETPLAQTVRTLADQVPPDSKKLKRLIQKNPTLKEPTLKNVTLENATLEDVTLKGVTFELDVQASLAGLFSLVASLDSSSLVTLAMTLVESYPHLAGACSVASLQGMLGRVERGEEGVRELLPLLERVMTHNAECRQSCTQWLHRKRKAMGKKQGRALYHSVMLLYLRQFVTAEERAEDDPGVAAIAEVVVSRLGGQGSVGQLDPTLLHVVCYLINLRSLERSVVDRLQADLLRVVEGGDGGQGGATLLKAHVQLLAATLREQTLRVGTDPAESDVPWNRFEVQAGQVLLCCVRYLTTRQKPAGASRVEAGEPEETDCRNSVVRLCRDLLCLSNVPADLKATIRSMWSDIVTTCLKQHYRNVQYIALLRQLVETLFTEEKEEASKKDDEEEDEDNDDESIADRTTKDETSDEEDSSSSDDDDDDDEKNDNKDEPITTTPKPSGVNLKSESNQKASAPTATPPRKVKSSKCVVQETIKRLKLNEKSAVTRKCVALFDDNDDYNDDKDDIDNNDDDEDKTFSKQTDHKSPQMSEKAKQSQTPKPSPKSEIVRQWTESTHNMFFLWTSSESSSPSLTSPGGPQRVTLVSASDAEVLVDLCEKIVGHTAFLAVMQGKEEHCAGVRRELVHVLVRMVRVHTDCCHALPLNVLVAAYGATLSLTDQGLLYLMMACDVHGNEHQRLTPGLWGERAVKAMEDKRERGRTLQGETTLENILHSLDVDRMELSILNFPLLRTTEFNLSEPLVPAERMMSRDDCYDPRFLLQLFFHFMGPEHIVDVRSFIACKALGYTFTALSSHDAFTRTLAIAVLAHVYSHLEMMTRWTGAPVLIAVLKVIMNAMTKEAQKLPCMISVFLAKASDVFLHPEHEMYVELHSFLLLKPALDANNVPEFFKFFNSPNIKERQWTLRLLQQGLRETSDHRLCQRRHVYKVLMCHATSSLTDTTTMRESMKVLVKACSIATVVKDMVIKHGVLPWTLAFINTALPDTPEMTRLVCHLLHAVCYTPEFNRRRLWWLSLSRLSRRCLLKTPLMSCVNTLLQSSKRLDLHSLQLLEDIVQHPYLSSPSPILLPSHR